jgi:CBS domain-containing protein
MLPMAFTLDERATVAQAAALMAIEDLHHVPIISARGRLVGVVSSLDIVRWLACNDGVISTGAPGSIGS